MKCTAPKTLDGLHGIKDNFVRESKFIWFLWVCWCRFASNPNIFWIIHFAVLAFSTQFGRECDWMLNGFSLFQSGFRRTSVLDAVCRSSVQVCLQFKCETVSFIRFPTNSICICKSKLKYLWYSEYIMRFASEMTLFMNALLSMLIFHMCFRWVNAYTVQTVFNAYARSTHTNSHNRPNQMGFPSAHFYPNGIRVVSCVAPNSFTQLSSWKQKILLHKHNGTTWQTAIGEESKFNELKWIWLSCGFFM